MSRLENKMKAGYFPTPSVVVSRIAGHLSPPESGDFRWLDPCAGEGAALNALSLALGGETYGIELDENRAQIAAKFLDHALTGDYKAQRLPKGERAGISVLFLNPPYDTDDTRGGRLELTFLRDTQEWLMPGGILIYIIPQYRISAYIARRLSTFFQDVRIYRFPDPEFADFRQVVIFARKREKPTKDDKLTLEIACAQTRRAPCPFSPPIPTSPSRSRPGPNTRSTSAAPSTSPKKCWRKHSSTVYGTAKLGQISLRLAPSRPSSPSRLYGAATSPWCWPRDFLTT